MKIYFIKRWLLRTFFKLIRSKPTKMKMVRYWRKFAKMPAKVTKGKDGAIIMQIGENEDREDYDFPGWPRGYLLSGKWKDRPYGPLSVLKHEIKNQLFNESWYALEGGKPREEVIRHFRKNLNNILAIMDEMRYEMLPVEKMVRPVREIWRAFTKVEDSSSGQTKETVQKLKETICFILQEDDAYRFRVQWMVMMFNPKWLSNPIQDFKLALEEMEHAEVVGDMKERIRLLRGILLLILEDECIKKLFLQLWKEIDWRRVKLSKGDKYHFRGKYFKVDFDKFEY